MTYKIAEIYDSNFLDTYFTNVPNFENITDWIDGFAVSVEKFVEACNITLKFDLDDLTKSGEFNSDTKKIRINPFEPYYRQRFTMAHELGHALLHHQGILNRADTIFQDVNEQDIKKVLNDSQEILANKFAADLLMPKKLVVLAKKQVISEMGWSEDLITWQQSDFLVEHTSKLMGVSNQAMRIRFQTIEHGGITS